MFRGWGVSTVDKVIVVWTGRPKFGFSVSKQNLGAVAYICNASAKGLEMGRSRGHIGQWV